MCMYHTSSMNINIIQTNSNTTDFICFFFKERNSSIREGRVWIKRGEEKLCYYTALAAWCQSVTRSKYFNLLLIIVSKQTQHDFIF